MNRRKRADYSATGGIWWNFDQTASITGLTRAQVIWVNIAQKVNRLKSLFSKGEEPKNESVVDTKLDLAVYAILYYAEGAGYDDGLSSTGGYDVMDGTGRKVGELP